MSLHEEEEEECFSISKREWISMKDVIFRMAEKLDSIVQNQHPQHSPCPHSHSQSGSVSSITSQSTCGIPESTRFWELSNRQFELYKKNNTEEQVRALMRDRENFLGQLEIAFYELFILREKFSVEGTILTEVDAKRLMLIESSFANDKRKAPSDQRIIRTKFLNVLKRYVFQFFNDLCPSESAGM